MTPAAVNVNGEQLSLGDAAPWTTALDWLRGRGLTGAKEGCAEGECGACSILVARPGLDTATEWTPINACLIAAASLDGQEVVTAEGLGSPEQLHPVQEEMAVRGGSQCGYCTPGFICSMAAEYYRVGRCEPAAQSAAQSAAQAAAPSAAQSTAERAASNGAPAPGRQPAHEPADEPDHEHGPNGFDLHALSGNLCRCTGYRPIRDAAYALGAPPQDDPFAARRSQPPPPASATRIEGRTGVYER